MEQIIKSKLSDLQNESDVEQKFISPLLLSPAPIGLNYQPMDYRTKPDIRALTIGKGTSQKLYFPDYVIINTGLPLMIIEAKGPKEDLVTAYREARLYAAEVNSLFPHKINPCHKIIVTNGVKVIGGFWDSENHQFDIDFDDILLINPKYYAFQQFANKHIVFDYGAEILKKIRGTTKYSRPLSLLGGKAIQNEELQSNGFGATLSLEFKHLFNPNTYEERKDVVLNAYVKTKRHLKHVDPIDKIIKASIPLSVRHTSTIEDTGSPKEILEIFEKKKLLKNQILLLVGSVGSGKSTFTDYLREVALDESTVKETVWISINLNLAPLNREEIYSWIKHEIVIQLKNRYSDIDFDELDVLEKLFSVEILAFKKGGASLLPKDSIEYKKMLATEVIELNSNLDKKSKAFVRYLCAERGKLLTIVLDNSDKRGLNDQLLMFDVASWIKETFSCLVFLPIRDTTFNNFRKEPPLDTVIKDFVFRIDPPLLKEVIISRLKYALREMSKDKSKHSFTLPNGMIVEFPQSDQGYYLACIVKSLFEAPYFSRLITGLAGRDIRKGLEIFLDFCKSAHISESEIFKIRQSKGEYSLPNHLISRIILRGNRKYYSEESSNVKNLFACYPAIETLPDPYCRLSILRWLKNNHRREGPSRSIGYHKISTLCSELISLGHAHERLIKEIEFLVKSKLIMTESQIIENVDYDDLIAIAPSGIVHLELLNDLSYISATSEDVWYRELQIAEFIQGNITDKLGAGHFTKETSIENAKVLIDYLENYQEAVLIRKPESYLSKSAITNYSDLSEAKEYIQRLIEGNTKIKYKFQYPVGTMIECDVVSVQASGLIVEFDLDAQGFVHISSIEKINASINDFSVGDKISGEITGFKENHNRFSIKILH